MHEYSMIYMNEGYMNNKFYYIIYNGILTEIDKISNSA